MGPGWALLQSLPWILPNPLHRERSLVPKTRQSIPHKGMGTTKGDISALGQTLQGSGARGEHQ